MDRTEITVRKMLTAVEAALYEIGVLSNRGILPSFTLDAVGRPQDAVTHMRHALQLDPLSFIISCRLAATLYLARQYDEALVQLQRAAEME